MGKQQTEPHLTLLAAEPGFKHALTQRYLTRSICYYYIKTFILFYFFFKFPEEILTSPRQVQRWGQKPTLPLPYIKTFKQIFIKLNFNLILIKNSS